MELTLIQRLQNKLDWLMETKGIKTAEVKLTEDELLQILIGLDAIPGQRRNFQD